MQIASQSRLNWTVIVGVSLPPNVIKINEGLEPGPMNRNWVRFLLGGFNKNVDFPSSPSATTDWFTLWLHPNPSTLPFSNYRHEGAFLLLVYWHDIAIFHLENSVCIPNKYIQNSWDFPSTNSNVPPCRGLGLGNHLPRDLNKWINMYFKEKAMAWRKTVD